MSSRRHSVFRAAALERLSSPEQLDARMAVVAPRGWLALTALGLLVLAVALWGFLGRIPVEVRAHGQFLAADAAASGQTAVVLVDARDVRRIRSGMTVRLVPVTHAAADAHVAGTVAAIGGLRMSPANALGAPAVASFEVRVTAAMAGFPAGLPCTAMIRVAEQRPIALVLPGLGGEAGR